MYLSYSSISCFYSISFFFTFHVIQAVLDAHDAVISSMKPGVSWVDMHMYD